MFKKNDKIALIGNWDNKGTVRIRRGTVHAVGKKIMRVMLENGDMLESAIDMRYLNTSPRFQVVVDDSNEALEALAMAQAEALLQEERERFDRCLAGNHGESYDRAIREDIDALHEPKVIWG